MKFINKITQGDCLEVLNKMPAGLVNTCVTSPPYWGLRDYGVPGQFGVEESRDKYISNMVRVFRAVHRVLRDDGTLWLNLGDSYNAYNHNRGAASGSNKNHHEIMRPADPGLSEPKLKPKDLIGIPWHVAFALQSDGWYLRQDIIWSKPNPMPESVTDRCTKAHEYIFLLSKSQKYYYNGEAIKEPIVGDGRIGTGVGFGIGYDKNPKPRVKRIPAGWDTGPGTHHEKVGRYSTTKLPVAQTEKDGKRNKRSVWTVNTQPMADAHFATFPENLIDPCIKAGCPKGGVVLDPFMGAGTTARVAIKNGCQYVGIELNPEYIKLAEKRNSQMDIMEVLK